MATIKVKFLRPLDGMPEGTIAELSEKDAIRLQSRGAVKVMAKAVEATENKMECAPDNKSTAKPKAK